MSEDTITVNPVAVEASAPHPDITRVEAALSLAHDNFLERTVEKLRVDFPHLASDWDALALWFSKHV